MKTRVAIMQDLDSPNPVRLLLAASLLCVMAACQTVPAPAPRTEALIPEITEAWRRLGPPAGLLPRRRCPTTSCAIWRRRWGSPHRA
jgi:hypothetical protein